MHDHAWLEWIAVLLFSPLTVAGIYWLVDRWQLRRRVKQIHLEQIGGVDEALDRSIEREDRR